MSPITTSAFTAALVADGPAPESSVYARGFGSLVGSWAVKGRRLDEASGIWKEREFTWIVSFILGGHAIQDVEVVPSVDDPEVMETLATGVRVYDPDAGLWRVSFFAPQTGDFCHLVASRHRDGIRQDGSQTDERPIRWNFSAITETSYVWDAWVSNDDGRTWELTEHNEAVRVS
ncbi:hypothetical protein [Orlajensenia leifsoniae]|uniref:DUF1579 domain-containing protein n=1 Tax=Orlajensenia leifsoniae TaxID=2561933 RepID=A0A4Y9R0Y9_9MICO|nr:hypothetical protein [Leifsonia flava]TFV98384.1 hypothetical protein E4M00_10325 [Leifsonia flava]